MTQLFKMAIRDLGRNRRRTFFSMLAVGMGLALLLLMASFITGEIQGAFDRSIKLQSGDIQVRARTYNESKASLAYQDLVENPDQVAAQIASLAPVTVATPRLYASGIIVSGDNSTGVQVVGIEPASPANAPFRDAMVSGQFITADDRAGILIGQSLANKIGVKSGDTVNLMVNTSNGGISQQNFTVRGIYNTHTPGYDDTTIFMPLAKAQAISDTQNYASTIFVLLKNKDQANAVVNALQGSQYQVQTWIQMNDLIYQTEQLSNAYMWLLYLIVLGITATVIINTLIMSVFERTREIGILSAIGMKSSQIMSMFLAESTILAVGGIVMGLILGLLMVSYATTYGFYIGNFGVTGMTLGDTIHASLTLNDAITLSVMAFIITLLAALYPAILAAHMEPVQALHGGK